MDFLFFKLLNAVLFIRPQEFVPALYALPVYQVTIAVALLFGLSKLIRLKEIRSLTCNPILALYFGLAGVAVLSNLVHLQLETAADTTGEFFRTSVYILLLIAVVDTPDRLRAFVGWMVLCSLLITSLALVDFLGYAEIPHFE